ncbi:hypothetical protein [Marinobacter fonticola]|uniref:hypothetical protein n=1 Tax=Marinobacter fonticola TaxID=2603215 RepID=UPI0011E6ECD6|nr:hypothetical protein [Marinobacter fonticola]
MSYDLRDFLMFTPEVYLRLFERQNTTFGLWLLVAAVALLAVPALLCSQATWARRLALVIAAVGWGATASVFMHRYYAPINWPVSYFAWMYAAEGLLLIVAALRLSPIKAHPPWAALGLGSVLMLSLLTAWAGDDWKALALPGLTPDMTALATIVLLTTMPRGWRVGLLIVPLFWCLFSVLTHWALGLHVPLMAPLAGVLLAVAAAFWPGP